MSDTIQMSGPYSITETTTGVRCGNHGRGNKVRHADAANVRACYQLTAEMIADQEAEIRAERAYVTYLENRGYDEARLQDEMEDRMGVHDCQSGRNCFC